MREIREGWRESWEDIKDRVRQFKDIRQRAARNRALMTSHPIYKQQLKRDLGRVVTAAMLSAISGFVGFGFYAHIEAKSNARAAEECTKFGCKEDVIDTAKRRGVEPNPVLVSAIPSFAERQADLDEKNKTGDILPVVLAGTVNLGFDIYALGAGSIILVRHRRKLASQASPSPTR